jgi:hypothetical protein
MSAFANKVAQIRTANAAAQEFDTEIRAQAFSELLPLVDRPDPGLAERTWKFVQPFIIGLSKFIGFAVAVLTGISIIVGVWFILRPNTEPVTEQTAAIETVAVTRNVTLGHYTGSPLIQALLRARDHGHLIWSFPASDDPANDTVGDVANINFSLKGFSKRGINLRWSLLNAKTSEVVAESEEIDPFCRYDLQTDPWCVGYTAVLRDNEVGSFAFWIDTGDVKARCVFLRAEIYRGFNRLTFKDSPAFQPALAPRKPACATNPAT